MKNLSKPHILALHIGLLVGFLMGISIGSFVTTKMDAHALLSLMEQRDILQERVDGLHSQLDKAKGERQNLNRAEGPSIAEDMEIVYQKALEEWKETQETTSENVYCMPAKAVFKDCANYAATRNFDPYVAVDEFFNCDGQQFTGMREDGLRTFNVCRCTVCYPKDCTDCPKE